MQSFKFNLKNNTEAKKSIDALSNEKVQNILSNVVEGSQLYGSWLEIGGYVKFSKGDKPVEPVDTTPGDTTPGDTTPVVCC